MIKISSNQSYETLRKEVLPFFESLSVASVKDGMVEVEKRLPKWLTSNTSKVKITPLHLNHENLISSELMEKNFIPAINFIRESYEIITNNLNKIDTRKWMNDEIVYDISEFQTPNGRGDGKCMSRTTSTSSTSSTSSTPSRTHRPTQKDTVMNAFKKCNLRYMCVKGEGVIYIFYVLLSSGIDLNSIEEVEPFIGGLNYIISTIDNMGEKRDSVNVRARYTWELTTLFNLFYTNTYNKCERKMLPSYLPHHHLFPQERKTYDVDVFEHFEDCWLNRKYDDEEIAHAFAFSDIPSYVDTAIDETSSMDYEAELIAHRYLTNYKNVIHVISLHFNSSLFPNPSISKLITFLADLTKPECEP